MPDRSVAVRLRMEIADYVAKANQAQKATGDFLGELGKSKKASQELSNAMAVGGAALAGGFLLSVKAAMTFEKQMSEVAAVSGATGKELDNLSHAALAAGAATAYSATEAAKAEAELAKAGLSTADILGGALAGSLSLAAAGSLDLAEAADVAAKTMNVFQLSGKDVGHIADVLASASNKSATDVHELGMALKMGGLAADSAGMTLEQTVGTLAAFADHALVGSDAGTSLKTMLMMLQTPTKKAAALMHDLGIEAYDSGGTFVGTAKLADELQTKLGGLTQEERNAALATIFGADAMRAANILYEQGAAGINGYTDSVNDQGAAAEVAAKKMDNLSGDVERLKGSLETLAITGGTGAVSGLRQVTQGVQGVVDSFAVLPSGVQSGLTIFAGVGGAALLAGAGLLKAKSATDDALKSLANMGPTGAKAATGLGKLAGAATILGGAVLALQTFSAAWAAMASDPAADAMRVPKLSKDLEEFARSGKMAGEVAKSFGKDMELLKYDLGTLDSSGGAKFGNWLAGSIEGITGLGNVADMSLLHARQRLGELDSALAQMVTNGNAEEAKQAFDRIAEAAAKQGVNIDELTAGLPGYTAAQAGANASQLKGIEVGSRNNQSLLLMNNRLSASIDLLGSFQAAFDQFNGGALTMSEAQIAVEAALDNLDATLDQHKAMLNAAKTGFDLNTEAGRAAQQQLNEYAKSAAQAAEITYQQTGSVDQASATFEGYKQRLIETLDQSGLTRAEAERLANEYMSMPPNVLTRIQLYGTDDAAAQIQMIKDSLARLPGTKTITIKTKAELPPGLAMGALMRADGGTVDFYANGGVRGRENHVADIVPAGTWRVWGEPETGGEAYIPFAESKRPHSVEVLAEANRRLGSPLTPTLVSFVGQGQAPAASPAMGGWQGQFDPMVLGQALRIALADLAINLDGARVGQIQGREGQLLQRGG